MRVYYQGTYLIQCIYFYNDILETVEIHKATPDDHGLTRDSLIADKENVPRVALDIFIRETIAQLLH